MCFCISNPLEQGVNQPLDQKKPCVRRDTAIEWINKIHKVPSHYCRASSSKQYVDSSFQTESHMYNIYADYSRNKGQKPLFQ